MAADAWTTVAAFTAAGFSVINVAVSARLANSAQLKQWKRTSISETTARILRNADELLTVLNVRASMMDQYTSAPLHDLTVSEKFNEDLKRSSEEVWTLIRALKTDGAELELVTSPRVTLAARELTEKLWYIVHGLRPGGSDFKVNVYRDRAPAVLECRETFAKRVRADLGTASSQSLSRRTQIALGKVPLVRKIGWVNNGNRPSHYDHL